MTKLATLWALSAALLTLSSHEIAPAMASKPIVRTQNASPAPLHSLTGIAFHIALD